MTEPTPAQERNLQLAREGLRSWIGGDRDAAVATVADDVEIYVPSELGNAGRYRGIDGLMSWVDAWEDAWSEFQMEVVALEAVGERHVVEEVDSTATGTLSGVEVGNTLGWVLGLRDDKLEYLCLQPSLEEARRHAEDRDAA